MPYTPLQVKADPASEDSDPFAVTPPTYHKATRPNTSQILSDNFQRALSATTRFVPVEYSDGDQGEHSESRRGETEYHLNIDAEDDQTFVNGNEEVRLLGKAEGRNSGIWDGLVPGGGNGRRGSLGPRSQWRELMDSPNQGRRFRKFVYGGAAVIGFVIFITIIASVIRQRRIPIEDFSFEKTVILVSLDGFRADYLYRNLTPTLAQIGSRGVVAEYMQPSFPSITFPNHYTIVTGLYPESHGIVANTFYDPSLNDTFIYVNPISNGNGKWWGGEPIWVSAVKQNKLAGTCMWPGSEAPIQNIRPTYWLRYKHDMPLHERVDHVLGWLDRPVSERPHFLSMYISNVDSAGHSYGVGSKQVNDSLKEVDEAIKYMLDGLDARGLTDKVNILVVSDHGMADTSNEHLIFLDDYIDMEKVIVVDNMPIEMVYAREGEDLDTILSQLQEASESNGHFKVWRRQDVPPEYHYSHSERIGPLLLVPEDGWVITLRSDFDPAHPVWPAGLHGYNNSLPDMRAIFVAAGSAFNRQTKPVPAFSNLEVYNLMARIIGVEPAPNNGTTRWVDRWIQQGYLKDV